MAALNARSLRRERRTNGRTCCRTAAGRTPSHLIPRHLATCLASPVRSGDGPARVSPGRPPLKDRAPKPTMNATDPGTQPRARRSSTAMITGHAMRVLLFLTLVVAWGCRGEPDGRCSSGYTAGVGPAGCQDTANGRRSRCGRRRRNRRLDDRRPENMPRPFRAKAISTGDPELDPLVSFLRAWFAEEIRGRQDADHRGS